jgi:dTDP-3-amino-3,4,6-trideoxy-alpha-D-glucose transaminase
MLPVTDLSRAHAAIRPELEAAVRRVLDSNRFILGPEVEAFEQAFAAACGTRFAVACGSGTDAITLTLRAFGVGAGDEVIVPALTAAPTAAAVVAAGATPVFADVDAATRTLDPVAAAAAVTPRTRALLPVHLYGRPADMDALGALARRHGLCLIEDAAQAHGARWRGRPAGALGAAACFSFYPTKNLGALGDAGAVTTDDPALVARLQRLRDLGQSARYRHEEHSTHSRMDALQAALLAAKLPHLERWNADRRAQAARYRALLAGAPVRLPPPDGDAEPCWHLFVVESDAREEVRARLRAAGIGTDVHYPTPVHLQPAYAAYGRGPGSLPVSERLAATVLSLPLFPGLTAAEQARVAAAMTAAPVGDA